MNTKFDLNTIKEMYAELKKRLEPLKEYWLRLSQRDQQILTVVFILSVIVLIYTLFNSALMYRNKLIAEVEQSKLQYEESINIIRDYKRFNRTIPNDFSTPNTDVIKTDAEQILAEKDVEVTLIDSVLNIKSNNVEFDNVISFLEQLRKSYGLFPIKLKITRLPVSGFVAVSIDYVFKGEPPK